MANIVPIQYNGELGYKKTIRQVFEYLKIRKITVEQFLDFEHPGYKLKNRDMVWMGYDPRTFLNYGLAATEEEALNIDPTDSKKVTPDAPCPVPITFYIDSKYLEKTTLVVQSNLLVDNFSVSEFDNNSENQSGAFTASTETFYKQVQNALTSHRMYDGELNSKDKILENRDKFGNLETASFPKSRNYSKSRIVPHVYIWCKSLNEGKFSPSSVFDLSAFILNMNMTVSETGGNFNIQLAPVEGLITCGVDGNPEGIWNVEKTQYINFEPTGSNPNIVEREHYFKTLITKYTDLWVTMPSLDDNGFWKYGQRFQGEQLNNLNTVNVQPGNAGKVIQWTKMFFEQVIAANDVVFISYGDPFQKANDQIIDSIGESNIGLKKVDDFFIDHLSLVGGQYEMIGLVDTNSISHSPENDDVTINITGRDCMKLLIEDGSYFFAKSYANPDETVSAFNNTDIPNQGDSNNAFNNAVSNPGATNRLITTGILDMLFIPEARNVNFVLNMLMSRLANIEVCPSELFEAWGDRRTKFSIVTEEQTDENKPSTEIDETTGD
jgi:hypothetical protein